MRYVACQVATPALSPSMKTAPQSSHLNWSRARVAGFGLCRRISFLPGPTLAQSLSRT
jgi:hypothetical protein